MIVLLTQVSYSMGDALRYHIWHPAVAGRAWIFICETVSPLRLPCNHLSTNLYKWLSGGRKEDGDRLISVVSSTRTSSTQEMTGNPNKENLFHCRGDQTREQVSQTDCEVSIPKRCSNPTWIWSCVTCCSWPCFSRRYDRPNMQRSLLPWGCDSVILTPEKRMTRGKWIVLWLSVWSLYSWQSL